MVTIRDRSHALAAGMDSGRSVSVPETRVSAPLRHWTRHHVDRTGARRFPVARDDEINHNGGTLPSTDVGPAWTTLTTPGGAPRIVSDSRHVVGRARHELAII